MLQALNTGHDGSLTTVHANSPEDALRRIETLALMAGVGLPHAAVRDQVASALDLVVHQARLPDGARVVESVSEVRAGRRRSRNARALCAAAARCASPAPATLARATGRAAARGDRCSPASLAAPAARSRSASWRLRLAPALVARGPRWLRAARGAGGGGGAASDARGAIRVRSSGGGCWPAAPRLRSSPGLVTFGPGSRALRWRAAGPLGVARLLARAARALPPRGRRRACPRSRSRSRMRSRVATRCAVGALRGGAPASAARPATSCAGPPRSWPPEPRPSDALEAHAARIRSPGDRHARGRVPAAAPRRRRPGAPAARQRPGRSRTRRGSRARCAPRPPRRASPALSSCCCRSAAPCWPSSRARAVRRA